MNDLPPPPSEVDNGIIEDGFGSEWVRCALKDACGLHVVRPGKARCYLEDCPEEDS